MKRAIAIAVDIALIVAIAVAMVAAAALVVEEFWWPEEPRLSEEHRPTEQELRPLDRAILSGCLSQSSRGAGLHGWAAKIQPEGMGVVLYRYHPLKSSTVGRGILVGAGEGQVLLVSVAHVLGEFCDAGDKGGADVLNKLKTSAPLKAQMKWRSRVITPAVLDLRWDVGVSLVPREEVPPGATIWPSSSLTGPPEEPKKEVITSSSGRKARVQTGHGAIFLPRAPWVVPGVSGTALINPGGKICGFVAAVRISDRTGVGPLAENATPLIDMLLQGQ